MYKRNIRGRKGKAGQRDTYNIRAQAESPEVPHAHLSRLSLLLVHSADHWNQRHVNEAKVLVTDSELELPHGLDKRSGFDVANGSTELFMGFRLVLCF